MPSTRKNSINLGLPATPEVQDRQLFQEFVRVYNAVNLLADFLDIYTNSGGVANGSFTNVTISQLLDLSAATAGRIKFPVTQVDSADVHTLDDYEEGTFVPGIAFGGAAVGVTYVSNTGNYTKIGNRVFYSLAITTSSRGTSVGSLSITGLPFAVNAIDNSTSPAGAPLTSGITSPTGYIVMSALAGTTAMNAFSHSGAALVGIPETSVANATVIRLSGQYRI